MPADSESLTTAAAEARRWDTVACERRVLALVRTYTSAVRLLDALTLFASDFRVGIHFAFDNSSVFSGGVPGLLESAGIRYSAWPGTAGSRFDLAVMATENIDFGHINSPIVVLPHGVGFNRHVPDSSGPGTRLAGVVPARRLAGKRVRIAVPHPSQQAQLRADYPEAAACCVVVGDMIFDELISSLPLRDWYRVRLGVREGQRLVTVTSTWGPGSLWHTWPDLPTRLLAELPTDEYRVALVLHPNLWSWPDEYQVRLWLARARAAGLIVLPPSGGWQAALIAADAVIGDHGSVTMYAAALDRPVLLAGDLRAAGVVPGTSPDRLAGTARRIERDRPLDAQVAAVIAGHRPGWSGALADGMFARQGEAALALRDLLYEQLSLPVPAALPLVRTVSQPPPADVEALSHVVFSQVSAGPVVILRRYPAAVRHAEVADPDQARHQCADEADSDRLRLVNASVIVRRMATSRNEAAAWIGETFRQYPGCGVAASAVTGGSYLAGLKGGGRVSITTDGDSDLALAASAVYACWRAGVQLEVSVTVHAGARSFAALLESR